MQHVRSPGVIIPPGTCQPQLTRQFSLLRAQPLTTANLPSSMAFATTSLCKISCKITRDPSIHFLSPCACAVPRCYSPTASFGLKFTGKQHPQPLPLVASAASTALEAEPHVSTGPSSKSLPFRVGHGFDLHRLEPGYPLIIGGINIPHERGCEAHSDGDVLLHCVVDAILGAFGFAGYRANFSGYRS